MADIPKKLVNFNFYLEGKNYSGLCDEITLPKYSVKKMDYRSAGMLGPIEYNMGVEKLEATIKLPSFEREPFLIHGITKGSDLGLIFRGAIQSFKGDEPIKAVIRGCINSFDFGSMKAGEDTSLTFTMWCHYFSFARGEITLLELDLINNVERFGAIDRQELINRFIRS